MKKLLGVVVMVAMAWVVMLARPSVAADEKPVNDIKAVMQKAHKAPAKDEPNLRDRATGATGSDADKKALLALYQDLAKSEAPKGDKEAWTKATTAMAAAAKELVEGKQGAAAKVKRTSSCKSCHDAYKG